MIVYKGFEDATFVHLNSTWKRIPDESCGILKYAFDTRGSVRFCEKRVGKPLEKCGDSYEDIKATVRLIQSTTEFSLAIERSPFDSDVVPTRAEPSVRRVLYLDDDPIATYNFSYRSKGMVFRLSWMTT